MPTPRTTGLRILLIDDEVVGGGVLKMMLQYYGHPIEMAENGDAALSVFEKNPFDLIITDYTMPGMMGDKLAEFARHHTYGHPLTGVDCLIGKPFLLEDLRNAMAKVFLRI
jgi:two-component system, NarL family, capsular synthesis sensor histidine kinase RcsC